MALRNKVSDSVLKYLSRATMFSRLYSSKVDLRKLRPMILKRIEDRLNKYPIPEMTPVAQEVLHAKVVLVHGVSILLKIFPVMACNCCPEVYIGKEGHLIKTCHGYKRHIKNQVHRWRDGTLNDILVPVETYHLHKMSTNIIKHDQRFDFDRVPAVNELCYHAGGVSNDEYSESSDSTIENIYDDDQLRLIANKTLKAWEMMRSGVKRLLLVYPTKVCKYCSEVHVGSSGHKARLCGVFKFESWKGMHFWERAGVNDLVPPKIVWKQRPQDPQVLVDEGRDYYRHAPAVVDLCTKAGAIPPSKYHCMMKVDGLTTPTNSSSVKLQATSLTTRFRWFGFFSYRSLCMC